MPAACSSVRAAVDDAERTTKHAALGQTLVTTAHVSVRAAISPTLDAADSAAHCLAVTATVRLAKQAAKHAADDATKRAAEHQALFSTFLEAERIARLFDDPRVRQDLTPDEPSDSWKDAD